MCIICLIKSSSTTFVFHNRASPLEFEHSPCIDHDFSACHTLLTPCLLASFACPLPALAVFWLPWINVVSHYLVSPSWNL